MGRSRPYGCHQTGLAAARPRRPRPVVTGLDSLGSHDPESFEEQLGDRVTKRLKSQ